MQAEVSTPKEIPNPRMISIKNILPSPFARVLAYGFHPEYGDGYYIARRWSGYSNAKAYLDEDYSWTTDSDYTLKGVTHWMPIPLMENH